MNEFVLPSAAAVLAAVLSAAATPMFASVARWRGLVVRPRADRWHREPMPLLGGAAMVLAILTVGVAVLPDTQVSWVVLTAAAAAFLLGLVDDIRNIAPTTKLVGQALIAVGLVLGGVQVELVEYAPAAFVLTVFWVVGMMNAINLMDNMDGLAAGVTAVAAGVLAMSASGSVVAALLAAMTFGSAVGFLIHNFPPARVFMGDAGSQLLGFLLATAALLDTASSAANVGLALLGPLAVLALPIFDTVFVVIARRSAGMPIGRGGRDHTSHRLAALGFTDRRVVLTLYALAGVLALVGGLTETVTSAVIPLVLVAIVALTLFGAFLLTVDVYDRPSTAPQDRQQVDFLRSVKLFGRFGLEVGIDIALLTAAYYAAFIFRYEGVAEEAWLPVFARSVPLVVGIQLAALVVLRVYRSLWQYFAISDAVAIVRAVTLGTLMAIAGIVAVFQFAGHSRAVFVTDWLLASALLVGARAFWVWMRRELSLTARPGDPGAIIVGANDTGAAALDLLRRAGDARYRPIGFVDDDPGKRYRRVAGVPIVGRMNDLESIIQRAEVDLVVLASDDPAIAARVREVCERLAVPCRDLSSVV